jgi:predicted nucleic acid-binding protein
MAYLLDSDVAIDHLADDGPAQRLLARLALDGLTISVITNMEVSQGVLASPNPVPAGAKLDAFSSRCRLSSCLRQSPGAVPKSALS